MVNDNKAEVSKANNNPITVSKQEEERKKKLRQIRLENKRILDQIQKRKENLENFESGKYNKKKKQTVAEIKAHANDNVHKKESELIQ